MRKLLFSVLAVAVLLFTISTISVLADDTNDDWLHVEGNAIVDKDGNAVWLTGTNWFGFNTGSNMFDGLWAVNLEVAISNMADRGINLLRIPVSTEILHEWSQGSYPMPGSLNDFVNPEYGDMDSFELFDATVDLCKKYGVKIMVDVHSPKSEAMGHLYPLWYDGTYTTEIWISSQEWLAEEYKNDDTILAFDIENEPHGKPNTDDMAKWDDSTDINNWKHAAETCAKRLLDVNPNLLIMVEGIEVYPKDGYDYTAVDDYGEESKYHFNWWGGNLRGVADYPLDLGEHQDQLVYSPHDYGPKVHQQSWFYEGFNKDTLYEDVWYDNWFFIQENNTAPLLIGEWGGFMDGGDNQKWLEAIRDFIVENKIHHTFWCYNANSGDTGGLVAHDFETWEEDKYELLEPSLWQDSDGRFVSLDHQVNLGANGTNITEYYSNGEEPPFPPEYDGSNNDDDNNDDGNDDDNNDDDNDNDNDQSELGDIDGDGIVGSLDYSILRRALINPDQELELDTADLNQDGMINSMDIALFRQYLTGRRESL